MAFRIRNDARYTFSSASESLKKVFDHRAKIVIVDFLTKSEPVVKHKDKLKDMLRAYHYICEMRSKI